MRISYSIGDGVLYKGELGTITERSLFEGYTVSLDNGQIIQNVTPEELETAYAPDLGDYQ